MQNIQKTTTGMASLSFKMFVGSMDSKSKSDLVLSIFNISLKSHSDGILSMKLSMIPVYPIKIVRGSGTFSSLISFYSWQTEPVSVISRSNVGPSNLHGFNYGYISKIGISHSVSDSSQNTLEPQTCCFWERRRILKTCFSNTLCFSSQVNRLITSP